MLPRCFSPCGTLQYQVLSFSETFCFGRCHKESWFGFNLLMYFLKHNWSFRTIICVDSSLPYRIKCMIIYAVVFIKFSLHLVDEISSCCIDPNCEAMFRHCPHIFSAATDEMNIVLNYTISCKPVGLLMSNILNNLVKSSDSISEW